MHEDGLVGIIGLCRQGDGKHVTSELYVVFMAVCCVSWPYGGGKRCFGRISWLLVFDGSTVETRKQTFKATDVDGHFSKDVYR